MATVRRRPIRTLTKHLLQERQIDAPPVDVTKLAEEMGVVVHFEPADDELSGFLLRDVDHYKALIGVNKNHHPNRQRFTIAHELGHLLLHEGEPLHVDRGMKVNLRDGASSQGTLIEEKEANLFAAELLMPAHFIHRDLKERLTLEIESDIDWLADKYEVSAQAMTFRLSYLKYLQL
jgi:Zn-dependent peptidase ImmA (M78 family)